MPGQFQTFCQLVDQFWNDVFSWICSYFKRDIAFYNFNKIFGFEQLENCNMTDLINSFLLNGRFLIYRCRKSTPNRLIFISTINSLKKQNIWLQNVMVTWKIIFESGISRDLKYYCTVYRLCYHFVAIVLFWCCYYITFCNNRRKKF